MKKTLLAFSICIAIILSAATFATAETIDLSAFSYAELVALKDQINLAIWNSQEWQEVTVPKGVWKVGEDIPAGHWTVKCAPGFQRTRVDWGEHLDDAGERIQWKGRYSAVNYIHNPNHKGFDEYNNDAEYSFEVRNGEYIVISDGSCVFTPYAGKPDLGFK